MAENIAHTLLLQVECRISSAQSLKQKRSVIKGMLDRLKSRFNASVAETGFLDEWQRSTIAIVMVSNNRRYLQQQSSQIEQQLLTVNELTVTDIQQHWL